MPETIAPVSIPKGFQRLANFPLDATSVFRTLGDLEIYAAENPTAYPGQTCSVAPIDGSEVQLYVLNSAKVPVIASGGGGGSGNSKYIAARQKVLTGQNATTTTLTITETLAEQTAFHRPNAGNFPAQKGWLDGVSSVSLGATAFIEGEDFVFKRDRQCFYFLDKRLPGVSTNITGVASANSVFFTIEANTHSANPSHVSTSIPTSSPLFAVTSVSVESEDGADGSVPFYYNRATATLFFKTAISASGGKACFKTERPGEATLEFASLSDQSEVPVAKILWPSVVEISVNGVTLSPSNYSFSANQITFSPAIQARSLITVSGPVISYDEYNFVGGTLTLPTQLKAVLSVVTFSTEIDGAPFGEDGVFYPFAALEETLPGVANNKLHLGYNYPTGQADGTFTVEAVFDAAQTLGLPKNYTFKFQYWPGNAFELPARMDNVNLFQLGGTAALVVFDATAQKLIFTTPRSGTLSYTATHRAYQGLAVGGEEFEVLEEIPGIYATTAGTGHYISTLRTFDPPFDWYWWWESEWERELVQIVDATNTVIYQDESEGAFHKSRPGYTAEELLPLTLKLPLAPLWALARRDDTSFFQEAFSPNYTTTAFSSATYADLDDTQRYAADSVAQGKTVTLSTNKIVPVRGVQGVNFTGPKPTYFAGSTVPYICLATYKWFAAKCTNTNSNSALTLGATYLLCVNNVHLDSRSIMVNITNDGFNVAADIFALGGTN